MPTTTVNNLELSLELDAVEYNCQVIDVELSLPGYQAGTTVEVACPDGTVSEPGSRTDGALTGNVYADPADAGITWILATAYQTGAEINYAITYWPNEGATKAIEFTGIAKVNSFKLPFSKPGYAKHSLDLLLSTAVMGRPTP